MLKRYVTEELELDPDLLEGLNKLAEEYNMSLEQLITELLLENMSKKISLIDFASLVHDVSKELEPIEKLQEFYTIVDKDEKEIARFHPIIS